MYTILSILSYSIVSYPILACPILSHPILSSLPIHLSTLPFYLSIHPSIHPSIHSSVHLCVCAPLYVALDGSTTETTNPRYSQQRVCVCKCRRVALLAVKLQLTLLGTPMLDFEVA